MVMLTAEHTWEDPLLSFLKYYKTCWSKNGSSPQSWRLAEAEREDPFSLFNFWVFKKWPATIGGPIITILSFFEIDVAQSVAWHKQNAENKDFYF